MDLHPQRVADLEWSEVDGGLVAYHPGSDQVHFMNHTGAMVVELCNGRHSVREIAEIVQAAYRLDALPEVEVKQLLRQARDAGLLADSSQPAETQNERENE